MTIPTILKAGESRVWIIENGASPLDEPEYMGVMKTGDPSWSFGDITSIKVPDPNAFNKFIEAASIRGAQERVTSTLNGRYPLTLSTLLRLARKQCRVDVQVAWGQCRNPQDYKNGWEKLVIFRDTQITTYNGENWGALGDDEQNPSNENVDISAEDMYEVVELSWVQHASTLTVREVTAVAACDALSCGGDCGLPSNGCDKIFATMIGTGATPGTKPLLIYTDDGGVSWGSTTIDTLFSSERPTGIECVGDNVVIVSPNSDSLHYADRDDILGGTETWYETFEGFVIGHDPYAIWSVDAMNTWIVGEDGYVYYTSDPTVSVTVQNAGVATVSDLYDVNFYDAEHGIAVGTSNGLIHTEDGETWAAVTGPEVGVDLNCCWMLSKVRWLVGSATGALWYTADSGGTWTDKAPSELTAVNDLWFIDDVVGYMAGYITCNGYIYRTTDGGYSWYRIPRVGTAITANDVINEITGCDDEFNVVWGVGLADNGTAGVIFKGS